VTASAREVGDGGLVAGGDVKRALGVSGKSGVDLRQSTGRGHDWVSPPRMELRPGREA
jgi:hypothetical protein